MLGMFNLHPLLKGWEYKIHPLQRREVIRGADPVQRIIRDEGWLIGITSLTTDCYGTFEIDWQGAELETKTISGNPESAIILGAVAQDPMGWIQRYYRPNPSSTAGVYLGVAFSGGGQGSAWPYVPTVTMKISLPTDSTQSTAFVNLVATVIAITDKKAFLKSLRAILGIKGKIDPALFTIGPAVFKEELE